MRSSNQSLGRIDYSVGWLHGDSDPQRSSPLPPRPPTAPRAKGCAAHAVRAPAGARPSARAAHRPAGRRHGALLRHVLTRRRRPRGCPRVGLRRSDAGASDQRRTPCTMGSVADPVGSTGAAPARPPTQPTPSPPESIPPPPPSSLRDPALTCLAGCARSVAAGPSSGAGGRGRPTEGRRCGAESAHGPGPLGPARPLDLGAPHPVSRIRLRPARPSPASRLAEDPSLPLSLPLLYPPPPPRIRFKPAEAGSATLAAAVPTSPATKKP